MKTIPWILAVVAFIVMELTYKSLGLSSCKIAEVSGTLAALSGTLCGFVFTSLSIIASIFNFNLIKKLAEIGHLKKLIDELFLSATTFLASVLFFLICLFSTDDFIPIHLFNFSLGALVYAITMLTCGGYHFYLVLINLGRWHVKTEN